eukprot:364913-Chlamydomonas_euryale.AAC.4
MDAVYVRGVIMATTTGAAGKKQRQPYVRYVCKLSQRPMTDDKGTGKKSVQVWEGLVHQAHTNDTSKSTTLVKDGQTR